MAGSGEDAPQILAGKVDEDLKCSICLELFKDPLITNCGHTFCSRCVYQVISQPARPSIASFVLPTHNTPE